MPHVRSARDLVQADQARIQNEEVQVHKIKKASWVGIEEMQAPITTGDICFGYIDYEGHFAHEDDEESS